VGVEADCVEGLYNLGMVNLKVGAEQEAHNAFDKLHTILPSVHEAVFQLGAIYERRGAAAHDPAQAHAQYEEAAKTYEMLLNKVPGDSNLCSRLGLVYEKMEDENVACHWQTEAHRHYPVNLNVISWLGVWYVKREMYEQAIEYFDRAAQVNAEPSHAFPPSPTFHTLWVLSDAGATGRGEVATHGDVVLPPPGRPV
jgi:intraflagellar transport protein 88